VLSARDEGHAKAGTIFAGFLKILPVFMLVLPGIIAFALFPEQVKKPDFAYPTLVLNLLPTGLVGLVMAALLAAVMGAMSSVFNSASTLVTLDFYKKIRPEASEKQLVNFGRIATGMMVVLGLLWVPFIGYISSQLYIYLQSVQAYISPPISACFVLGILWPRLNGKGAISSLLTGFVMGATRFVMELADRAGGQRGVRRHHGQLSRLADATAAAAQPLVKDSSSSSATTLVALPSLVFTSSLTGPTPGASQVLTWMLAVMPAIESRSVTSTTVAW